MVVSLCSNFLTSADVSSASRKATHSPRGKSALTAWGPLMGEGGCGTAVHSIFKISVDLLCSSPTLLQCVSAESSVFAAVTAVNGCGRLLRRAARSKHWGNGTAPCAGI